jgi:GT2 family glycosyltransferase
MSRILCSIATYKRYDTTLPLVLSAVANQTRLPDKVIIYDDNESPQDLRGNPIYSHYFNILLQKGVQWEVVFAQKKGQHYSHQLANMANFDWVWRVDDDCVPESNVLENLELCALPGVGAVGGSILTPPVTTVYGTGKIEDLDKEKNLQWGYIHQPKDVDHLHCSFMYRAGIVDFHLGLSRVAHREETLFTYKLKQRGYRVKLVPNAVSWHLKSPTGGIRSGFAQEMFDHDERIFRNFLKYNDKTIVVLNCGKGDHVVFSHVLPSIKNPEIFTCYPDIVPGRPISDAIELFENLDSWNIYAKMDQWKWKDSLEKAFRKMYL